MQTGLTGVFGRHVQQCDLFGHDRLAYRNIGGHDTLVVNHSVAVSLAVKGRKTTRSAIRWYELRGTGGNFSVYQQGTFAPDDAHRWMGSMAINSFKFPNCN